MRKIKIMMMMPLFLAVSLFFAGCGQSVDNDSDDTPTGGVPERDAYLSSGERLLVGLDNSISNGQPGASGTVSWSASVRTIEYAVGAELTLNTFNIPEGDGTVYPLVPAGNTLILSGSTSSAPGIKPDNNTTVVVEGALYLTNGANLLVGAAVDNGRIRLRNSGHLFVTKGTVLSYDHYATDLSLILDSANSPALLSGGISFGAIGASGTLSLANSLPDLPDNGGFIRINPAQGTDYINLSAIWASSNPATVFLNQGGIKSAEIFGFQVGPNRVLAVYNSEEQRTEPIFDNKGDITIQEGLWYENIGNSLEHVNLVVEGRLNANRSIVPATITVGEKGYLINDQSTTLDTSLLVKSGGVAELASLTAGGGAPIADVEVQENATLQVGGTGGKIGYTGPILGTLILNGEGKYTVNTTVGGKLVYYKPISGAGTVTLNNAELTGVELSGGNAQIKDKGAELKVNGSLELEAGAAVRVGGSIAANYAALELNEEISLTGGFTLRPVVSTVEGDIISTAAEMVLDSAPVTIASTNPDVKDKGALLGSGKITFTNGGATEVYDDDSDVTTVYSELAGDKFTLGAVKLVGSNSIGYGTLSLTDATIVFGATVQNDGVSLVNGQYIISSGEDSGEAATRFVLGELEGFTDYANAAKVIGIGIGPLVNAGDVAHTLTLGPGSGIVFGGNPNNPKFLLVGPSGAPTREDIEDDDDTIESPFAIKGIAPSTANVTISIPNYLVVGSLGALNGWDRTEGAHQPLFVDDTNLLETTKYASGNITAKNSGTLSVSHNVIWKWEPHRDFVNEPVGKWTF
jgi:hypothetical protein